MKQRKTSTIIIMGVLLLVFVAACSGSTATTSTTTTPGSGSGAVVNSDSILTGTIESIRTQTTGYPWELNVRIHSTQNAGDLPNPITDKIGQVVTMKTDEDMASFQAGQTISARAKYTGDVPKPGITLYIYDIKAQ
jgi:hypothetical protein